MRGNFPLLYGLITAVGLGCTLELHADASAPSPNAAPMGMHDHNTGAMYQAMPDHKPMAEHGTHHDHDQAHALVAPSTQPAEVQATVTVGGVVVAVLPEQRQLKVRHEAIEAWQMGPMQMRFEVAPQVSLDDVHAGQRIQFKLRREGIGRFQIVQLQ